MNKLQFTKALEHAKAGKGLPFKEVWESRLLDGCAYSSFKPVAIEINYMATWLKIHCLTFANTWDNEELDKIFNISKRAIIALW